VLGGDRTVEGPLGALVELGGDLGEAGFAAVAKGHDLEVFVAGEGPVAEDVVERRVHLYEHAFDITSLCSVRRVSVSFNYFLAIPNI
jgi:hypothetical protein